MANKLVGRKLYIKWGEHMYVAIEKIPAGDKKLLEMELGGSDMQLCNVVEDENGKLHEEILGAPANGKRGYTIDHIFVYPEFWMTPGEKKSDIENQLEI